MSQVGGQNTEAANKPDMPRDIALQHGCGCDRYVPDYEAQGDCLNCGWGWEFHKRKEGSND